MQLLRLYFPVKTRTERSNDNVLKLPNIHVKLCPNRYFRFGVSKGRVRAIFCVKRKLWSTTTDRSALRTKSKIHQTIRLPIYVQRIPRPESFSTRVLFKCLSNKGFRYTDSHLDLKTRLFFQKEKKEYFRRRNNLLLTLYWMTTSGTSSL